MLSFTLSGNISMDNHQWWLSQAYTCAFHISMHIHITFMTYHLYMLIVCQYLSIHVLCLWHIFYLYFYCILVSILYIFFASFLYFHVHFLSCSYIVHVSYTFISRILSYNLSYTVMYFYLHSYTFHIRYFCML